MRVVLGALIWCICLLLFGIPIFILVLVKLVVTAISCRSSENIQGEKLVPLKGDDGASGSPQWEIPYNIGFCLRVQGNISVNEFRNHFSSTFNLNGEKDPYDKFFSYFVIRGGYVFRAIMRDCLDLSKTIVDTKLEEDELLENFLVRWMLIGYEEKRSRWQVAIIPLSEDTTAVAFKMDHNLIDVYSFIHILDKLTGSKAPYLVKDFRENFCGKFKQIIEGPTHLGAMKGLPREQNPFHCIYPVSSPERKKEWMFSFTSIPVDDMKVLRKWNGSVRMASVIFTILVGALRRFLIEEVKFKEHELPLEIKMGNSLPWPKHPAMNENLRGPDRLQNQWTGGFYTFPLRESDALLRLQKIEQKYVSLFDIDMGAANNLVTGIGADTYNLLGCPVERVHPLLGIPDNMPYVPLSCFTFSHSGRMEVVLGANPQSIFQNKQRLDLITHKLMHDELKDLLSLTKIHVQ
ncbi:uncharacterized protein LOC119071658 isoform X1 [Bradysia coprophila]|uniref:uncharacterized protein LOC119071658 isoform X1 n=1 Tax=Bradysia coprophila TaxID=38358 RepID=UPI00187DBE72|nr:uncharacterized protein LOC119071658 isoform X1 [Bradysia coprophila]